MRANAESRVITPDRPLDQGAGSAAADVEVRASPDEPLEVNALAIWPDSGSDPVLLVSLDLLYPGPLLRATVERAAHPLPPDRIMVAASHTHQAPMTDPTKPKLGAVDKHYLQWLEGVITGLVSHVLNPSTAMEVTLRAGSGLAAHSINRRLPRRVTIGWRYVRRHTIRQAPNLKGTTDETLTLATIESLDGYPIAHFWNYSCHPVSHPDVTGYSGHYVSVVRDALRQQAARADLPVLFFQGFSGDTRPSAAVGIRGVKDLIRTIVNGPLIQVMRQQDYRCWADSLAQRVLKVSAATYLLGGTDVTARRLSLPGSDFAHGLSYPVTFQAVSFGPELTLLAVSAEVVGAYAHFARTLNPGALTMCIGCADHTYGYLPTRRMVEEGGYEAEGFCAFFEIERVLPEIETVTRAALASVLHSVLGK